MKIYLLNGIKDCIVCSGKIKDYDAFLEFKHEFITFLKNENLNQQDTIFLFLEKCFPLENYFFGFLLKLNEFDKLNIKVITNDFRIVKSFEELRLDKKFDIMLKEII